MALIRCPECKKEISDKATACPGCGAPVDASTAVAAPNGLGLEGNVLIGTPQMIAELAKKAITRVGYRVDAIDVAAGTATFTTGVTMGSWSGVSGTISWDEVASYRFSLSGRGKQNVQGGQVVAFNLFDEANAKAEKVIAEMRRLAGGGAESEAPAGGCVVLLLGLATLAVATLGFADRVVAQEPSSLNLICVGGGTAIKPNVSTMNGNQSGSFDYGAGQYSGSYNATVTGTRQQGYADQVDVELIGDSGRIRLPRVVLPLLHGGEDGWFTMKNVQVNQSTIEGTAVVNFMNKPKVHIDRRTGSISIAGKAGTFAGQCQKVDNSTANAF